MRHSLSMVWTPVCFTLNLETWDTTKFTLLRLVCMFSVTCESFCYVLSLCNPWSPTIYTDYKSYVLSQDKLCKVLFIFFRIIKWDMAILLRSLTYDEIHDNVQSMTWEKTSLILETLCTEYGTLYNK